jgi:DNA-binding HxlR family transcriptional regulator
VNEKKKIMKSADLQYPQCPIRNVLARFSDKWSLLILTTLHEKGMLRYSEICKSIPDISQKMLSATLKRLEEDGLINRVAFAEIPPRVEYSLTEMGESLIPIFGQLIDWSLLHFREIVR